MVSPRGFTLIELLVVIAIIGLLASVILANLNSARANARDARRKADFLQLANAINLYYDTNNHLPRSTGWCTYISNASNGYGALFQGDLVPTFIVKVPLDPIYANQSGDYFYKNQDTANGKFYLCAIMETTPGTVPGGLSGCSGWSTSYNYCALYQ